MSRRTGADGGGTTSPAEPTNNYTSEEKSRRPKGESEADCNGSASRGGRKGRLHTLGVVRSKARQRVR